MAQAPREESPGACAGGRAYLPRCAGDAGCVRPENSAAVLCMSQGVHLRRRLHAISRSALARDKPEIRASRAASTRSARKLGRCSRGGAHRALQPIVNVHTRGPQLDTRAIAPLARPRVTDRAAVEYDSASSGRASGWQLDYQRTPATASICGCTRAGSCGFRFSMRGAVKTIRSSRRSCSRGCRAAARRPPPRSARCAHVRQSRTGPLLLTAVFQSSLGGDGFSKQPQRGAEMQRSLPLGL